jgi:hypothetical protein
LEPSQPQLGTAPALATSSSATIRGKMAAMDQRTTLSPRERQEEADRFTATLAGFVATLLLAALGLWVAEGLAQVSKLEDCLLQGRMNCERIELQPSP